MVEITLNGTPTQIGLKRGQHLKYVIQLAIEHYVRYHTQQFTLNQAYAHGRRMAKDMEKYCPELVEEIYATGKAADVQENEFLAYAFRCWNALMDHPASLACYNMAAPDPKRGTLIAGVIEDLPPFYILETVQPNKGIPFYGVTWAGMAWAIRCMNKAGLAIGQASSFAGTRYTAGTLAFPFDLYARAFYAERSAIQNADNVADAVEIIRSFDCASVFMLADKNDNTVILEACGKLHAIRRPDEFGVLTGGVFLSPELIKSLVDEGIAHDWECGARTNKRVATKLHQAKGKTTMEWMAKYLQTEQTEGGWCHDGLQAATLACPRTGEFWVSGYRPCVSGFKKFDVSNLSGVS